VVVLQSCFVAFFGDRLTSEQAVRFIKNMCASAEVRHKMYFSVCLRMGSFSTAVL